MNQSGLRSPRLGEWGRIPYRDACQDCTVATVVLKTKDRWERRMHRVVRLVATVTSESENAIFELSLGERAARNYVSGVDRIFHVNSHF